MRMTERAEAAFPRAIPRRVCSSIRQRAHQLARQAYEDLCAELMDAVAAGAVRVDEVSHWRPEQRG